MKNLISKFTNRSNPLFRDQRGITGLETAIVLIAFVVVSSVFAFAQRIFSVLSLRPRRSLAGSISC